MKRSEKRAFCYAEIQITPPAPLPSPHLRDRDGVLYRDRNTRGRFETQGDGSVVLTKANYCGILFSGDAKCRDMPERKAIAEYIM